MHHSQRSGGVDPRYIYQQNEMSELGENGISNHFKFSYPVINNALNNHKNFNKWDPTLAVDRGNSSMK